VNEMTKTATGHAYGTKAGCFRTKNVEVDNVIPSIWVQNCGVV